MKFINKISRFHIKINLLDLFNYINFNKNNYFLFVSKIQILFKLKNFFLVSQGRVGLYLILQLIKKKFTKEKIILMSPYTLTEVINCIYYSGFKIKFIDIDITTGLPEYKKLEKEIKSRKISAVLLTHLFTKKKDFIKIKNLLNKTKVLLINDHAINLGSKFNNKLFGTESDYSFYSFNYQKNLSTINGGMVTCKNKKDFNQLEKINKNLIESSTQFYIKKVVYLIILSNFLCNKYIYNFFTFAIFKNFLYKHKYLSRLIYPNYGKKINMKITHDYNFKFNKKLSYFGLKSINSFTKRQRHRIKVSNRYVKIFDKFDFINDISINTLSTKLEYPVLVKKDLKKKLIKYLFNNGFEIRAYWYSNPLKINSYKNCNLLQQSIICFPTHVKINNSYLQLLEKSLSKFDFLYNKK